MSLKNVPCLDCGKSFHYCQMDFDHVRGVKLRPVPHMRNEQAILDEAVKCDVVCANCHRERTQRQKKGTLRVDPTTVDMVWKTTKGIGVNPARQVAPSKPRRTEPAFRPWHAVAGTKLDCTVAEEFGISRASVHLYRKRLGIPRFKKAYRGAPKLRAWHSAAGTASDKAVAERFGVSVPVICSYRKRFGIVAFRFKKLPIDQPI
jgi:hypothetical protein